MDALQAVQILSRVEYKDWSPEVVDHGTFFYFRWTFTVEDKTWHSRNWLLSKHMTVSELVQTVFKAALTAEEHEARELFTYRGTAVFGPHFSVEKLVELCLQENHLDIRP